MNETEIRPTSRRTLEPLDLDAEIARLGERPNRCLLCQGEPERLFRRSGKWFWRCGDCALVFVHDIYPEFVTDIDHLRDTYSFETLTTADVRKRRKFDRRLRLFEPHRRSNRLLEVGCGQGLFLERAKNAGWRVHGVDVLFPVVELARRRGLDVSCGELFDAGFEDATFDVVFLSEVIEHIVEPIALMREIHRVLRPGGVAILGTCNACSWSARLRGSRWSYYRFGGHLHIRFYNPEAARALGRRAGFERVACETRSFAFLEAEEMRGKWYKPLAKLGQSVVSPLAGPAGAGHRLRMTFHRGA